MSTFRQSVHKVKPLWQRCWNYIKNHEYTKLQKTCLWGAIVSLLLLSAICSLKLEYPGIWENIIADCLMGAAMVVVWQRVLRKIAFFDASYVSLLHRTQLKKGTKANFETRRYEEIITDIKDSLDNQRGKKFFFFLLQGPEQSGKTSFVRYINSEKSEEFQVWEIHYAALTSDSAALENLFDWICNGDERWDKCKKRIVVFHAGDSVKQANYLMEELRILSIRLKKMLPLSECSQCIFVVQLTGRHPMDAVFSDFQWDKVFNNMLTLNYITPDKMAAELDKEYPGLPTKEHWEYTRMLYLHSLGIPAWYCELKHSKNEGGNEWLKNPSAELFKKRVAYCRKLFPVFPGEKSKSFEDIISQRDGDPLQYLFLANTYLLEVVYDHDISGGKTGGTQQQPDFLPLHGQNSVLKPFFRKLMSSDLITGRRLMHDFCMNFVDPFCKSLLIYDGFLPTKIVFCEKPEKNTIDSARIELLDLLFKTTLDAKNADYLRSRLLLGCLIRLLPYHIECRARVENAYIAEIPKCISKIVSDYDQEYADVASVLLQVTGQKELMSAELRSLTSPAIRELITLLSDISADDIVRRCDCFLQFSSRCRELFPADLTQLAELLFFYASNKLYQAFLQQRKGDTSLKNYLLLDRCIRDYRASSRNSRNLYLVVKLEELETLRMTFARPVQIEDIINMIQNELVNRYEIFYDGKTFLQCHSWVCKQLLSPHGLQQLGCDDYDEKLEDLLCEYSENWQEILYPSEIWLPNNILQIFFLVQSKIQEKSSRNINIEEICPRMAEACIKDLESRLSAFSNEQKYRLENGIEPVPFSCDLLCAQISYLFYIERNQPENRNKELFKYCRTELQNSFLELWKTDDSSSNPDFGNMLKSKYSDLQRFINRGLLLDDPGFICLSAEVCSEDVLQKTAIFRFDDDPDRMNLVKEIHKRESSKLKSPRLPNAEKLSKACEILGEWIRSMSDQQGNGG